MILIDMGRVCKISDEQFVLDMINKEFEIIGSSLHWDTFEELSQWSKLPENENWFSQYEFANEDQYNQWKSYYMEHFYDWKPKHYSKTYVEKHCFPWFSLEYGFAERWEK
jgi:hypothetical protein